MNALLDQFLSEATELLSAVDDGLLRLERDPHDRAVLDDVFRYAHTFKGSSGLFELPELTSLTHAAEDLLDAVRAGELALQPDDVDNLLAAFDVVRSWLDAVAVSEQLPADAGTVGAALSVRLRARLQPAATVPEPRCPVDDDVPASQAPRWLLALGGERLRELAGWLSTTASQVRAVRYIPDAGCFFRGEDPIRLVAQVPAVEALHVGPAGTWPEMKDFDEYDCRLVLTFLTRAGLGELRHVLRYVEDEVELVEVDGAALTRLLDDVPDPDPVDEDLEAAVLAVLRAQRDVLAVAVEDEERRHVRLRAAIGVALSALSSIGAPTSAASVAGEAELGGDEGAFTRWIEAHLGGTPTDQSHPEGAQVPAADAAPAVEEVEQVRTASRVLKVDAAKVDSLLELVGELVVAKNALPFLADDAEVAGARAISRRIKEQYAVLDRIAEALQGGVMDVRMLPVQVAFARMPRLVRDLARKLGKSVELVVEGEDTAADKDVIEALGDPLVHLVRNSLDHGLEDPEERRAGGKPETATLRLTARQDGEAVVVELVDDGRGVDVPRVKQRAYERGLISEAQLETLSEQEAVDLVFAPGFSTAAQVSDVSGRGVGMDAVRSTVEALGGSISLRSSAGVGMTVRLRLPLSMAVSRVMVVSVAGQRFGVPVDVVRETVRVPRREAQALMDSRALVLRDTVVPLVDLAEALQLGSAPEEELLSALVVDNGGTPVGLVVDRFHQDTEVLLKPLEGVLHDLPGLAGTALLGDGQVLLVLDTEEVLACP